MIWLLFALQVHAMDFTPGRVVKSDKDAAIPKSLSREIERIYLQQYRIARSKDDASDAVVLGQSERHLIDITVDVYSERGEAVSAPVRFALPRGGGTIDLADSVTAARGPFKFKVDLSSDSEANVASARVFYVSNARRRKILGDSFGTGCDTYHEISTAFHRQMAGGGIELQAAEQRYVSVMAGTYFFVVAQEKQLHLGSLTVMDSRYSHLQCEG